MADRIISKPSTPEYEAAWERIFMEKENGRCLMCGRLMDYSKYFDDLCMRCRDKAEDAQDIRREIEDRREED